MGDFKRERNSRRALSLDHIDVELLACLTMLSNATIIVIVPSLCEVDNCWSIEVDVNDISLSACLEVFLLNQYHSVMLRPVLENCNFGYLEIVLAYFKLQQREQSSLSPKILRVYGSLTD